MSSLSAQAPQGLSAACRIMQLAQAQDRETHRSAWLKKDQRSGAHILSGAVLEPKALSELFPDWQERGAPLNVKVTEDTFFFYTSAQSAIKTAAFCHPQTYPQHWQLQLFLWLTCVDGSPSKLKD